MRSSFSSFVPVLLAGGIVLAASATSRAGEARTHDGFFLRLSAGGGGASTSISDGSDDLELSGPVADLNFAIGGCIAPNFAVHGTLWGWSMPDPDFKVGGLSGSANDATIGMSGAGIGITYYVMPANFYLSPSVGIGTLRLELDNVSVSSDTGFSLDLTVGKEWWVSDGWGIGLAGDVNYHRIPDGDIDDSWSGVGFGLRFSSTMN